MAGTQQSTEVKRRPIKLTVSRRGSPRYEANPFWAEAVANTTTGIKRISNSTGDALLLVTKGTGEVHADVSGFQYSKVVDETQFLKFYANGVRAVTGLGKAGSSLFEVVAKLMQESMGKDFVYLSLYGIDQTKHKMGKSTFSKGMADLIEKRIIAETMVPGKYYINPDFVFNGDRLTIMNNYVRETKRVAGQSITIDAVADSSSIAEQARLVAH